MFRIAIDEKISLSLAQGLLNYESFLYLREPAPQTSSRSYRCLVRSCRTGM